MGEWSLVRRYLLAIFIAFPVSGGIPGTRNIFTGAAGRSLTVRESNSALITSAASFALITSFLKNSLIMLIMKSR